MDRIQEANIWDRPCLGTAPFLLPFTLLIVIMQWNIPVRLTAGDAVVFILDLNPPAALLAVSPCRCAASPFGGLYIPDFSS